MLKLIVAALTAFSVYVASLMQEYVDKQNEMAAAVNPRYAQTLSVTTDPSKFAEISRKVLESARTHAPEFAKDVEKLIDENQAKISVQDFKDQLATLEAEVSDVDISLETAKRFYRFAAQKVGLSVEGPEEDIQKLAQ